MIDRTRCHLSPEAPIRVLVLQHLASGHPWYLRGLLAEAGCDTRTVRLDLGEALPPLASCDALLVLGGVMQVWQEDEHPWLVAEKRFIRAAVESGRPYLGICLGHQLLASAFGGDVGLAVRPEIGILPVETLAAGRTHPAFRAHAGAPRLQWHVAEVTRAPAGFEVLARSDRCEVQALAAGNSVLSVQYHAEADIDTLPAWFALDSARDAFGEDGDPAAAERFQHAALAAMPALNAHARDLVDAWLSGVTGRG